MTFDKALNSKATDLYGSEEASNKNVIKCDTISVKYLNRANAINMKFFYKNRDTTCSLISPISLFFSYIFYALATPYF